MKQKVYLVVATDNKNGIGKDKKIPWQLKREVKFFKKITQETEDPDKINMVIMGRTTWESIPKKYRPLSGRKNVVLTGNPDYKAEGATVVNTYDEALEHADDNIETIHVIGGGKVYETCINHPDTIGIYLTKLEESFNCDTFFPKIPTQFTEEKYLGKDEENGIRYKYLLIQKP